MLKTAVNISIIFCNRYSSNLSNPIVRGTPYFVTTYNITVTGLFNHQFLYNYRVHDSTIMPLHRSLILLSNTLLLFNNSRQFVNLELWFEMSLWALDSVVTQFTTSITTTYVLLTFQYHSIFSLTELKILDWVVF